MTLQTIDHFVITTRNLDQCLAFYCDFLGMTHEMHAGQHALRFGSHKINLHTTKAEFSPAATQVEYGSQDFCLILEDDIHAVKAELEAKGYPIHLGVVERVGARGLMDSIYLYDPDGNLVELAQYRA